MLARPAYSYTLVSRIIVQDGINIQDVYFLRFPARLFGWFK